MFPEYQLLRFDPHRYPKGQKIIKPVAQFVSDLIILVFWGIWHVKTGKANTRWPWGHIIISPDPVSSTPRLHPFEEGRIWSSEHFVFIQTCKPFNRKWVTIDNYYTKMMPCLITCSKVDVTWSQSLTMSDLELTSGKLSLEHLTPGNRYFRSLKFASSFSVKYASMNSEVLFCNPNSLSCFVPLHTWLPCC